MMRLALVALLAAGCTHEHDHDEPIDCSTVSGVDTFVVGLTKDGEGGALHFAMMSIEPAPPERFDNTWTVAIADANGQPVDGATLHVTPFMTAPHDHGSAITVGVNPLAGTPGQYTLSPVYLSMPGIWETTIRATSADGTTSDSALYTFCIN